MYDALLQKADSDSCFSNMINTAREYAEIYSLSRDRQKGCDGMGETATLKEEFMSALDNLVKYCIEHEYLSVNIKVDYEIMAEEIKRTGNEKIA